MTSVSSYCILHLPSSPTSLFTLSLILCPYPPLLPVQAATADGASAAKRAKISSEDVDVEAEARKGNVRICVYNLLEGGVLDLAMQPGTSLMPWPTSQANIMHDW